MWAATTREAWEDDNPLDELVDEDYYPTCGEESMAFTILHTIPSIGEMFPWQNYVLMDNFLKRFFCLSSDCDLFDNGGSSMGASVIFASAALVALRVF